MIPTKRIVASYLYIDWKAEGGVYTTPEEGETFTGIPAGYYGDDEGAFIEIRRNGRLIRTVNCRGLSTVKFATVTTDGKAEKEPEAPTEDEDPPSEAEEPDKPFDPFAKLPIACRGCPCGGAVRDKLIKANRKLKAQAKAPWGVLDWRPVSAGLLVANSTVTQESVYRALRVGPPNGIFRWTALFDQVQIHAGTLYECQAACEAMERDPDSPPQKGS